MFLMFEMRRDKIEVWHFIFEVWHFIFEVWHFIFEVRHVKIEVWHFNCEARRPIFEVGMSKLKYGTSCFEAWHFIYEVRHVTTQHFTAQHRRSDGKKKGFPLRRRIYRLLNNP